ncbi:MAG: DMT family transporter [Pseudomonadota bacterium]
MPAAGLIVALLLFGSFWGLTIPMTKLAVSTGHAPIGLIFWQQVFVGLALAVVTFLRRVSLRPRRADIDLYIGVALIGTIIPNSFSYVAAANLPAGVVGIAIATVPFFALMIALALRDERFEARRIMGVVLGAAAVVLLTAPEASLPSPEMVPFVFVALIAPFCYGCEANYLARRAPPDADPLVILVWASVIGAIGCAPVAVFTGNWVDLTGPWGQAELGLTLSSLSHAVAYSGYIWLVGRAGAVFTSQIAYVVTVMAVLLSALILSEIYSPWVWLALGLMLAGLTLVRPRRRGAALVPEAQRER